MKRLCPPQAVLCLLISTLCSLTAACGGGPNSAPPPLVSVASTQHPLVAQVSVASACAGEAMVEFGPDTTYGRNTAGYPIAAGYQKITILVAGMRASTPYHMRAQVQCSEATLASADMTFSTGPLPSTPTPSIQVTRPTPVPGASENPGIELIDVVALGSNPLLGTLFTDRDANPIWYYDAGPGTYEFPFKLLPNGHIIANVVSSTDSTLREIDLAGNTIREIDIFSLQQKLQAAGIDLVPIDYHHDMLPLDNGHLLALVQVSKNFTDLPGYPGTLAVTGDAIIDLDQNLNPVWTWNSFDYLDVNRHLNGLPDWTHSNALVYSPSDGNIIISMRHQSWVLKIDYNNGAGTGKVLWRLGYQGDFALTENGVPTSDPSQWFSFQHFPSIVSQSGAQTTLNIWDNGDNRVLNTGGEICSDPVLGNPAYPSCFSRATLFQIDESAMVADLQWATPPLLDYSRWGGSINQLSNGNVEFDLNAPAIVPSAGVGSEVQEVTQSGTPTIVWQMDITPIVNTAYRAYRVPSLYPGVTWQY
jgi:arylsulfate sulfotransferase